MATVKQIKAAKKKTGIIRKIRNFFREVRAELKKVIWPSKEEVAKYTGAVLLIVAILGIFITIVDQIVSFLTKFLGW
ncbi:preprotein translocase subunit SecE [bacterium]|nr:preprotein translocase subunit SecE [bacterium]